MNLPLPLVPHKEIFQAIWNSTSTDHQIYLVGGAVRDSFLKKTTHDLDFSLGTNAIEICRKVANKINGAFYVLDEKRKTARIIMNKMDGSRQHLDFATFRGNSIVEDLNARDFTINAMALSIYDFDKLIDPLGGLKDLQERILRACSNESIIADPVRILRAARLSVDFNLFIESDTKKLIAGSINKLSEVSQERIRDEIFRILEGPKPATALKILAIFRALDWTLPEIKLSTSFLASPPEKIKSLPTGLGTIRQLKNILQVLSIVYDPETAMNWAYGYVSVRLGRYRQNLDSHFINHSNPERSRQSLLLFASLFCDSTWNDSSHKVGYENLNVNEKRHFTEIDARFRANQLRLSNSELSNISTILKNIEKPFSLSLAREKLQNVDIYRFFRYTNSLGIDICLLSLAHTIAQYGPSLPKDIWIDLVDTIQILFESWWRKRDEIISPRPLINGDNIMSQLKLTPGPLIGEVIEAIREAQAIGEVSTVKEAISFAEMWLSDNYG